MASKTDNKRTARAAPHKAGSARRRDKLARALRENLHRRKAQARADTSKKRAP